MSELHSVLEWQRDTPDFKYETYNRTHTLRFGGGISLQMSSAPEYMGNAKLPNPEELLAAATASCHFLTFLSIAAKMRLTLDSYRDDTVAVLDKNAEGKIAVTRITLRPKAQFSGDAPDQEKLRSMHEKAHHNCFIANSVKSEIILDVQY